LLSASAGRAQYGRALRELPIKLCVGARKQGASVFNCQPIVSPDTSVRR
jgi:hypothetical protein